MKHPPEQLHKKFDLGWIRLHLHPTVFGFSAFLIISVVFLTLLNLHRSEAFFLALKQWITVNFGWMLILLVQGFKLRMAEDAERD